MNDNEQARFDALYLQHLVDLKLHGKRPKTIEAYSRAVHQAGAFFDRRPDQLTPDELKLYFFSLVDSHSWSESREANLRKRISGHPNLRISGRIAGGRIAGESQRIAGQRIARESQDTHFQKPRTPKPRTPTFLIRVDDHWLVCCVAAEMICPPRLASIPNGRPGML